MANNFNEAELLERVDNDVEFLAETVEMLKTDGSSLIEQAQVAVSAGDAAGVGRHAHALKGMIANFCAPAAHDAARALEQLGKGGDLADAPSVLESLRGRLDALTCELLAFVGAKR